MWRNPCLNDTYEPGSTFKVITMAAGLRLVLFHLGIVFIVPDIKWWRIAESTVQKKNRTWIPEFFVEGAQNSCNPVFIEVGLRLGVERYYKYFRQFGLLDKTGTDLPGEAGTIMHQKKKYGRSGTGNGFFWTVFSDYTCSAGCNSKFTYKRRQTGDTAFWSRSVKSRQNRGEKLFFQ